MTTPENDNIFKKPLKIVFCLPGRTFSAAFLKSWTELLYSLPFNNITPIISQNYSPVVYWARNLCLSGDVLKGINQKPFNGMDYDYMMWIDSDMVFQSNDFFKLLSHNQYDIISGIYPIDEHNYSAVCKWDEDDFLKNGYFKFIRKNEIDDLKSEFDTYPVIPVSYNGFGFVLIKKGVVESIEYPWFEPLFKTLLTKNGLIRDFTGEDVAFCLKIQEKGYKVMVDTSVRLGHEKMKIMT